MRLEDIGFYTLCNSRAQNVSATSPMWRCEMILTDRCNFRCPYCRGLRPDCKGDIEFEDAMLVLKNWISQGLKHVRFSGGEPTLYSKLVDLVKFCSESGVERVAISSNGSASMKKYEKLLNAGVNDFSISLDACCASYADHMAGRLNVFNTVVNTIKQLSKQTYVTAGVVLTKDNYGEINKIVQFAYNLGVSDVRIIPSAQENFLLEAASSLDNDLLEKLPILRYRVNNIRNRREVRGIASYNCHKCHLVKDDSVVAGKWHFPCVIYLREGGNPIGKITDDMRAQRMRWYETHNTFEDPICKTNCLDICIDYNDTCEKINKV